MIPDIVQRITGRGSPNLIERPRLLEQLDHVLEHRLTFICAPPGYGKTTLALQFAAQTHARVVWHVADETQRDVYNLHFQALAALGETFADVSVREPIPGLSIVELTNSLSDYLRAQGGRDIIYFIDDAHHLHGSQAAETWLSSLITALPRHCHLVLISRVVLDVIGPEMIARHEVLPLGAQSLRFVPDEVEHLAQAVGGVPLAARRDVEALVRRMEGWPTGLMLAFQPLNAEFTDSTIFGVGSPETLFDALARNMVGAQTPMIRDFLLASSTVSRMQPELLIEALRLPNAMALLQEVVDRNLFVMPVPGGMMYHGLFREYLQREYLQRDPDQFRTHHIESARWYEDHHFVDDAVQQYIAGGCFDDAVRLIELYARTYYDQGKMETLQRWNADLTQHGVFCGWLLYLCAVLDVERLEYDQARANLHQAERRFEEQGNVEGVARVMLLRGHLDMQRGEHLTAIRSAETVFAQTGDLPHLNAAALRLMGFAKLRLGLADEALHDLEAARPLYEAHSDRFALTKLLMDLDVAYRQVGRIQDAADCLQTVVALRRELGGQVALAQALNNLGHFLYLCGDFDEAQNHIQEGLRIAARTDRRIEAYLSWTYADLQRDRGAFEEAVSLYNRAIELAGSSEPYIRVNVLIGLSWLRRWQDQIDDAEQLLVEAEAIATAHDLHLEVTVARVSRCAVMAQTARSKEALGEIASHLDRLRTLQAPAELAHALAVHAQVCLVSGEIAAADSALSAIVRSIDAKQMVQTAIAELAFSSLAAAHFANAGARFTALTQAVRRLRKAQIHPANIITLNDQRENGGIRTYSLRVQTMGKEIFERDSTLVLATEWRSAAAREIFLYLLFEGARRREDICLEFWPDKSEDKARALFHATVHRARQAVGTNVIVHQDEVYGINPDVDLWSDAHVFERTVKEARGKPLRELNTAELWRRAIGLYQGEFLPGLYSNWIEETRERLNDLYLEALITAGECAQMRADFSEAAKMFQQALKIDPLREEVHRSLMIAYRALGQKQKIKTHYEKVQRIFLEELGAEPAQETVQLVANLLN
ncbi:MAG: tetratricopeptide repeat protein [Anaerolineae bacterium]|nr:tetratricopeptide repeat protein [Anaerolineae bacterium]